MEQTTRATPTTTAPRPSRLRSLGAAAAVRRRVSPVWRGSWLHRLGRFGALTVYAYLGVLLLLLALENRLVYCPTTAAEVWLPPPAGVRVEDVELTAADGTPIHAWWAAPDGWKPAPGAVQFCHGNAGNVSQWGQGFAAWQARLRTGILVFDYPGYGKSGGRTSEAGSHAAADAAYDWLTGVKRVPGENVVVLGISLGCGPATDLAARRPHRALVLCSAFTSLPELAQEKFPWLPCRWLAHNQFDNLHKIAACRGPVFIAHGTADALIPFAHGERLFAAAPEPKRFLAQSGRGHNDTADDAFFEAVSRFLDETAKK